MKRFLLAVPLVLLLGSGVAHAGGDRCTASPDQRQPESAIREKLAAAGWQVRRVKFEDGCYEVYAIAADGNRIERYFDPVTLAPVDSDRDD